METKKSPFIKAINKEAVHRICSGQVVLSLAVAVKELVENSLDAGATAVEVRLREYGSELVEVSDNGSGVESHNFQGLTLKHHTSKLQDFGDLISVETFGFRGEALSSLCSLSNLTVTTRHSSADCGTRLVFDHNGRIVSSTSVARQLNGLLEIQRVAPSDEALEELNLKVSSVEAAEMLSLEGFISSCAHGQGRSTNDRQFYFVNSRPCEPTKVIKVVNEVYRQYNGNQQPFVMLNVSSARDSVDVNVTPDKRQVFLEHEKLLVATVKASLHALYKNIPSTYTVNCGPSISPSVPSKIARQSPASILSQWQHPSSGKRRSLDTLASAKSPKQAKLDSIFTKKEKPSIFPSDQSENSFSKEDNSSSVIRESFDSERSFSVQNSEVYNFSNNGIILIEHKSSVKENKQDSNIMVQNIISDTDLIKEKEEFLFRKTNTDEIFSQSPNKPLGQERSESQRNNELVSSSQESLLSNFTPSSPDSSTTSSKPSTETATSSAVNGELSVPCTSMNVSVDRESERTSDRACKEISLSMSSLQRYMENLTLNQSGADGAKVRFRAVIEPSRNKQAEEELSREITKDMFGKMEVIGQFNLGFIIARLGGDLFIVDQHATDEKFNFETLQRTTTISSQKLVVPQQLELTAVNESILIDNINIFKANGFEFFIDERAPATTKVKLTSIPISRNWTFGKDDIDELLFMLQDAPNTLCRPSRVRAMFASRACRKSVMIGTALNKTEMKRLLVHMGEIEQPWNCPHGRPTMRHLINLDFI